MTDEFFAFQRANGDWFTMDVAGTTCLPVFQTLAGARRAKARHGDLMVYHPQALGPRDLRNLSVQRLWLVDEEDSSASLYVGEWVSTPRQRDNVPSSPTEPSTAAA